MADPRDGALMNFDTRPDETGQGGRILVVLLGKMLLVAISSSIRSCSSRLRRSMGRTAASVSNCKAWRLGIVHEGSKGDFNPSPRLLPSF